MLSDSVAANAKHEARLSKHLCFISLSSLVE